MTPKPTKPGRLEFPDAKVQPPPAGSIGVRAYARRRTDNGFPISHPAIVKAIASGRIAAAVWRDEKGRPWIQPDIADELLSENTDPSAQRENPAGGRPPASSAADSEGLFAEGGPKPETARVAAPASERDAPNAAYNRSRAAREAFEAQLSRLRYQREVGELVRADVVRSRCENVAILVRDALRSIAPRIAGELAAETSTHRIEERLTDEIDRALEGLAELGRPLS